MTVDKQPPPSVFCCAVCEADERTTVTREKEHVCVATNDNEEIIPKSDEND
jgi:hypothetical protein